MKDFRDLKIWTKGHQIALETYPATARFPREELPDRERLTSLIVEEKRMLASFIATS